ncbi:gustatory receptor 68a-like [Diachasma alloeum]|uniref:Gustatory receptor n=1 Tax=Diachasma alloeum TaxID=454923 RepID=A0A4E0RT71_9HYME|nr:gustatory receptor 68a-like [Diachasma alloeum]THK33157.1 gustatory receptor 12 [Diachasma alloeum]
MNTAYIENMFVVKFVLLTFRLLGLAPMTISKSQASDHWNPKRKITKLTFSWSRLGTAYNLILILGFLMECYRQIPKIMTIDAVDKTTLSQMYRNSIITCANTLLIILLLTFCLRQRKIIKIGNQIVEIDSTLVGLRGIYQLKPGKTYILLVLGLNLILNVLLIAMRLTALQDMTGFMTMVVFNTVVFSFFILQYALVVLVAERRFAGLNEALLSLETKAVMINDSNRFQLADQRSTVVSIIVIKRAYGKLYELCSEISSLYAPFTIFIVIYFSTSLLFALYIIFFNMTRGHLGALPTVIDSIWISVRSFPFILLTTNVRKTHIQMQITSDITHKLHSKFAAHREIKTELKNFTVDLMHRNFQFTAYGIFPIDYSLLKSIASTITTYLVIFVQFQLASSKHEPKEKK